MQIDARDRIQKLGGCSFFQAYMSQPKHQLETFAAWAGKSSVSALAATVRAAGLDFKVLGLGRTYGTRGGTKLALMEEWLFSPEFTATYLRRNGT